MNPDISLVFCSRQQQLPDALIRNIERTIGCTYELVVIDNSHQNYSISEAYQLGYEKSSGTYIAYLHDDIVVHTMNWGLLMKEHLEVPGAGFCGIGGRDSLVRIPFSWKRSLPYIHLIQSDKNGDHRKVKHRPTGFAEKRAPVIMLDGVVLCTTRKVMESIAFDTQLSGFHAYDFDICIRSASAGYQNYVMYNIDIEHLSRGSMDVNYMRSLISVFKKHQLLLPLSTCYLSASSKKKAEYEGLNRLVRKMTIKGFSSAEIITVYSDFRVLTADDDQIREISRWNRFIVHLKVRIIRYFVNPFL